MAARRRSDKLLVHTSHDGVLARRQDELVVEEPMAIQLDGRLVATTMRTPGHDFELAAGFCHSEGLLAGAPVLGCRYCAGGPIAEAVGGPRASRAADTDFNVVTVDTGGADGLSTAAASDVSPRPGQRRTLIVVGLHESLGSLLRLTDNRTFRQITQLDRRRLQAGRGRLDLPQRRKLDACALNLARQRFRRLAQSRGNAVARIGVQGR